MIKSMTAYAKAEETEGNIRVFAEISSYNNRYSDMIVKMNPIYNPIEDKIKRFVLQTIKRGRIELKLKIEEEQKILPSFVVDKPKALKYYKALSELKEALQIKEDISLHLITTMPDIINISEPEVNIDNIWIIVEKCLTKALADIDKMRKTEGDFIAADFEKRLDFISKVMKKIEVKAEKLPISYRNKLLERIKKLINNNTGIDPDRIANEAAILADKSNLSEEIVRIASHMEQFVSIIKEEESSGKKLNFLLQEMNREINTIGSKSGSSDISSLVVEVKAELEKIREQVQNVE